MTTATIGQQTVVLAILPASASSPYLYEAALPGLKAQFIDRATQGAEMAFQAPDGAAISFRVVNSPTGITPAVTGAQLGAGDMGIELVQEPDGRVRIAYNLTARNKPANNQLAWDIGTTGGATFTVGQDGVAEGRTTSGALYFTQPPPTATDRFGANVPVTATYSAQTGVLTYTLANIQANRYPVDVDPTTITTSTSGSATRWPGQRYVHLTSDGTAGAFVYDGSAWTLYKASSPYTSWSSVTGITNAVQSSGLAAVMDSSTGNIHVIYKVTSGPDIKYRLLTYSGGTWSLGSENAIASGDHGGGGEPVSIALDSDGRIWVCAFHYTGASTSDIYYSSNGSSWTSSLTGQDGAGNFTFGVARSGNYIVFFSMAGSNIGWRRVSTNGSVGSWSASQTANRGVWNDHNCAVLADGSDRLMLVASPNGTDYAIKTFYYTPGSDTWSSATDIGTGTSDKYPGLTGDGSGNLYCVWSEFSATNSYAVVYKKWDNGGGTWGAKSTMQAAGSNRLYTNAACDGTTLLALDTAGTGSPYNVEALTASVGAVVNPVFHMQSLAMVEPALRLY